MRSRTLVLVVTALAIAVGLGGCFSSVPNLNLDLSEWIGTTEILVPFIAYGDGLTVLAEYQLDHWDDTASEWSLVSDIGTKQFRIPNGSSGLLTFNLWEDTDPFRLTFSILSTRDATAVPQPILTVEKTFYIDTTAPNWDTFDETGDLSLAPGAVLTPGSDVKIEITDSTIFDDLGGAPVRLYYTFDDSVPIPDPSNSWIDGTSQSMYYWYPTDDGDGFRLRMLLVDDAGNCSKVMNTSWYTET